MQLLGVDVGTTHCKAGLFDRDGTAVAIARRPTPTRRAVDGATGYDPDELWATVAAAIRELADSASLAGVAAVGIASMAETGALFDRRSGGARSWFVPWFDTAAAPYAARLARESDRYERFRATGQYPSFKSSLAKILALRERDPGVVEGLAGRAHLRLPGGSALLG
jgi:sugar (pentulose or hexulose) kinase